MTPLSVRVTQRYRLANEATPLSAMDKVLSDLEDLWVLALQAERGVRASLDALDPKVNRAITVMTPALPRGGGARLAKAWTGLTKAPKKLDAPYPLFLRSFRDAKSKAWGNLGSTDQNFLNKIEHEIYQDLGGALGAASNHWGTPAPPRGTYPRVAA